MISIPVSFLLAALFLGLLLSVVFWRGLPRIARLCFALLLALLVLETVFVGLRFAFGIFSFLPLQRVLPVWIAPLAFLSFLSLTEALERLRKSFLFHGVIASVAAMLVLFPQETRVLPDVVIGLSFAGYAAILTRHWLRGPDELSQIPVQLTGRWHRIEAVVLATMIATLIVDGGIAVLFVLSEERAAAWLVSLATLGLITTVAAVLMWVSLGTKSGLRAAARPALNGGNEKIVQKAHSVLVEQELFRDTGLTATRLARRVGVPDRELSRAINAGKGQSVSQFVNHLRVEEAARLLTTTDAPATQVMEKAGFLTRSNFYREFQKRYGMPPGDYRKKMQAAD
jgi:AraC-like DNA-binding protein